MSLIIVFVQCRGHPPPTPNTSPKSCGSSTLFCSFFAAVGTASLLGFRDGLPPGFRVYAVEGHSHTARPACPDYE